MRFELRMVGFWRGFNQRWTFDRAVGENFYIKFHSSNVSLIVAF